ncbi:RNA polymerase sigma-70 factor [Paenibacillus chondroitinus]|uniref:RNA polymerase sigma-70 factor n=1 Tax=Paenibacillus chondroitinus TaxID=59842 RepID=A0ABU6DGY3_9BACL|nr:MULTISPECIES: RNA polymerase sigma-70 factor [Paenibacillus]MCY9659534.1 RNA polymerase sigma-70 factor [Paenibacillus anseongense]MEB4796929.1 RNA polymerase sigma-70 factor [Paenibacillus chondroitinus]
MENARDAEQIQIYTAYKPLLFALAYRMLGSVMDAEDVVQETFLYLNEKNPQGIQNPKAYLCKMVTNRCIDKLRSASKKREVYVGPWLPEPLVATENQGDMPELFYTQKESLSTAYLFLLQQLSWVERAVFVLREVLQYDYEEIAEIVDKSSVNCRQIFRRAKSSISTFASQDAEDAVRPKQPVEDQANAIVEQFVQALASGNMAQLLSIVKTEAVLYSDGGGKVRAAIRPIEGAERIALFLFGVLSKVPSGFSFQMATVNGQLGVVSYQDRQPSNVMTFHVEDGQVAAVYLVANPDKLRHVAEMGV